MKRIVLFLIPFLFVSCFFDFYPADDPNTFLEVDYSNLISDNTYVITPSTTALEVFNLFYDNYGYGEFDISGTAEHTESATLIGTLYTETITCTVNKVHIYHIDASVPQDMFGGGGEVLTHFYVDFYNENGERLSYHTLWQMRKTNSYNFKTSEWFKDTEWYNSANSVEKTSWTITINN